MNRTNVARPVTARLIVIAAAAIVLMTAGSAVASQHYQPLAVSHGPEHARNASQPDPQCMAVSMTLRPGVIDPGTGELSAQPPQNVPRDPIHIQVPLATGLSPSTIALSAYGTDPFQYAKTARAQFVAGGNARSIYNALKSEMKHCGYGDPGSAEPGFTYSFPSIENLFLKFIISRVDSGSGRTFVVVYYLEELVYPSRPVGSYADRWPAKVSVIDHRDYFKPPRSFAVSNPTLRSEFVDLVNTDFFVQSPVRATTGLPNLERDQIQIRIAGKHGGQWTMAMLPGKPTTYSITWKSGATYRSALLGCAGLDYVTSPASTTCTEVTAWDAATAFVKTQT